MTFLRISNGVKLVVIIFIFFAFFLDAAFIVFLPFNYWRFDFLLLLFLVIAFLNPDYQKTIPLALLFGFLKGLNSVLPTSVFAITYLVVGFLIVFVVRNLAAVNFQSIVFIGFLTAIGGQLLIVMIDKIYFILGLSGFDIMFNTVFLKSLIVFGVLETILLALVYGILRENLFFNLKRA